ncbi:MAG TPA: hypothetical protein PLH31_20885, partial [Caulobacter sp.]|nr:hypothetical protein [Caulobacter sp.]
MRDQERVFEVVLRRLVKDKPVRGRSPDGAPAPQPGVVFWDWYNSDAFRLSQSPRHLEWPPWVGATGDGSIVELRGVSPGRFNRRQRRAPRC